MEKLVVELCPETGICSLVKGSGDKTDLMPSEVDELKKLSANDIEKIKAVIAQGNENFAKALTPEDIKKILAQIA
jgi:protein involved in ribonucleotide reduction